MDDRREAIGRRRFRRREADDEADDHQGEDQHAAGHVPAQDGDLGGIGVGHRGETQEAHGQRREDQQGQQPVQRHQERMIAG